jgi:hypothetical protein
MKSSIQSAERYIWGDKCDGWHLVKNQDISIIHEKMSAHTSEVRLISRCSRLKQKALIFQ